MTLVLADRVRETSPTAGSGPFVLSGAPQGYQTLSTGIGNANSSYFVAWDGAANWLVFSGTYTGGTNSVSVDSVLAQSAGFAGFAGAKTIWCDAPATLISPLLQMSASASGVQVTTKLGIGMVPTYPLDITTPNGTGVAFRWQQSGQAAQGELYADNVEVFIGSLTSHPLVFATAGTEKARFDINGNLGIGTTPSQVLDITRNTNAAAVINLTNGNTGTVARSDLRLSNSNSTFYFINFSTGYTPTNLARADGQMINSGGAGGLTIVTAIAQPIYFGTNNTEVARFDGTGKLGIGMVPTYGVDLTTTTSINLRFQSGAGVQGYLYTDGQIVQMGSLNNFPLSLAVNGSEKGRFDTSGRLLVGLQTSNASFPGIMQAQFAGSGLSLLDTVATATTDNAIVFTRNGSAVGSVSTTLTGTNFNPTSDKNLKTLDEDRVVDSGALIDAVSPHPFKWNLTGQNDYGFFAQELYEALGDDIANHPVVKGSPDEEFGTPEYRVWGLDMARLVPLLWAEIQSLRARMAQVEGTH